MVLTRSTMNGHKNIMDDRKMKRKLREYKAPERRRKIDVEINLG